MGRRQESNVVYLETLFKAPGVKYDGNLVFTPRRAKVDGEIFAHAMSADARFDPSGRSDTCGMTIPLDGKYLRFQARVCRDDQLAREGTGFCYFEVYADGKLLVKSDAIRSKLYPVRIDDTRGKRVGGQDLDVEVKGARSLRLVVRYASDFVQTATFSTGRVGGDPVRIAAGCLWVDAKLTTGEGATLDTEKLTERDQRVQTAARLAARSLRSQLQAIEKSGPLFKIAILSIREDTRISQDDVRIRAQVARVFFGGAPEDGRAMGEPLPTELAAELRTRLLAFSPRSGKDISMASALCQASRVPYIVAGYIEKERLYLMLIDTRPYHPRAENDPRPENGEVVGNATGWLNPP